MPLWSDDERLAGYIISRIRFQPKTYDCRLCVQAAYQRSLEAIEAGLNNEPLNRRDRNLFLQAVEITRSQTPRKPEDTTATWAVRIQEAMSISVIETHGHSARDVYLDTFNPESR